MKYNMIRGHLFLWALAFVAESGVVDAAPRGTSRRTRELRGQRANGSNILGGAAGRADPKNNNVMRQPLPTPTVPTPPSPVPPSPSPVTSAPVPQSTDGPAVVLTTGNELCTDAAELVPLASGLGRMNLSYGNTVAAPVANAPTCGLNVVSNQPGVWFFVRGTDDGIMTARTCHSFTNYDTKLSIYSGSCGNLQCIAADDDGCPNDSTKSSVSWRANLNEIYYILVHGWVSDPVGDYAVWVQAREPPNDRCAQAQGPLEVGDSVDGTTIFATLNFGSGAAGQVCQTSYGTVEGIWYFTIGTGNTMTADTCDPRTNYDTKIHIFTGECLQANDSSNLNCVRGNDNNVECGSLTSRKSKVSW
jgi:hypothetical protein